MQLQSIQPADWSTVHLTHKDSLVTKQQDRFDKPTTLVVAHHELQVSSSVLCVSWLDVESIHQLLDSLRGQEGRQAGAQSHVLHTQAQQGQQHSHGLLLKPAGSQQQQQQKHTAFGSQQSHHSISTKVPHSTPNHV